MTLAGVEIPQEADRRHSVLPSSACCILATEKKSHGASWQSQILVGRISAPASHRLGLEQRDEIKKVSPNILFTEIPTTIFQSLCVIRCHWAGPEMYLMDF